MTNTQTPSAKNNSWLTSFLWLLLAAGCFNISYASINHPWTGLFIVGYAIGLVQLTKQPTVRRAFYIGLATAYLSYAPQSLFMWKIFGPFAIVLWLVLSFWVALFAAIVWGCRRQWGDAKTRWLVPVVWTGLEYFRSELYYLKFSWLNIGYALPVPFSTAVPLGMYGMGFLMFGIVSLFAFKISRPQKKKAWVEIVFCMAVIFILIYLSINNFGSAQKPPLKLAAVQMEFPGENLLPKMLDKALAKNTNSPIFVLSEYTLTGGVPDSLKKWCRDNQRYLVVGGKDIVTNDVYFNTAFVVGTNGNVIFKQAKSVPIQFFHDGLPAQKQELWNSPWGRIGICICYDLSYTRVIDPLVEQGAELLIVPTMDVSDWGEHQHELHARVAPVRAAEYGIPIFRVASSGISQAVDRFGEVVAHTSIDANGEIFSAEFWMPYKGSLPLDRYLAPVCTLMTGVVLLLLLVRSEDKTKKGRV